MPLKRFALVFVLTLNTQWLLAQETYGPVECYRYARNRVNLDEKALGELCSMAVDDQPARCFERAIQYGTAPIETALVLCKRQVLEVIKR